jgi:tRNA (guanosine-2'-O-)-methyltransferase
MNKAYTPGSPLSHELIAHLKQFVTAERYQKFLNTLNSRTRHLTIALEDIFQPHNASAVLRTCDCFGIQDVHIIENRNRYEVNPDVALGASKWLNLVRYSNANENTMTCITNLKQLGYRVVATTPHINGHTPETLPLGQKTALIFGTELAGLSSVAMEQADDFVMIPMVGFTESLNISVSAAILIQNLTSRIRSSDISWQLPGPEKDDILINWLKQSINKSEMIVDLFIEKTSLQKMPD